MNIDNTYPDDWIDSCLLINDISNDVDILDDYNLTTTDEYNDLSLDVDEQFIDFPDEHLQIEAKTLIECVVAHFGLNREDAKPCDSSDAADAGLLEKLEHFHAKAAGYALNTSKDVELLAGILSYSELLPKETCQNLAIKLISRYGTLEITLHSMENPDRLQDDIGFDFAFAYFLKKLLSYVTGLAISFVATTLPALANDPVDLRCLEDRVRPEDAENLEKNASPYDFPSIGPEVAVALLKASDYSRILRINKSDSDTECSLASDREILIGVWWVYWSMKRQRDILASTGEIAFLWDILTNRVPKNKAWLHNIRQRCKQNYVPETIRIVNVPKAGGKIRPVPVICLEDKVALMALYAACYKDMERNDRTGGDYAYKYPPPSKIDQASKLNYIPRSFWYSYLNNYLDYLEVVNINLNQGRYVIHTDISAFVHNIKPEVLRESMRLQGYDPKLSEAICHFHKMWNDQENCVGVPFGNSLTTAGMKIVLCRIGAEMRARGYDVGVCFNYADDFTLVGKTKEDVDNALIVFEEILTTLNLQVSREKTLFRSPGDPPLTTSVETAVDAAYEECGMRPYIVTTTDGRTTVGFEVPESLTLCGKKEPIIDSDVKMSTVPPQVLRVLYRRHVKPYLDCGESPEKGVTGFTLYRMLQCGLPETKNALLHLYEVCPTEQKKILGWLDGRPELRRQVLTALVRYYLDPRRRSDPWLDYSRFLMISSLYRACQDGNPIRDSGLDALIRKWWLDPNTGFLTRMELNHFVKVDDSWTFDPAVEELSWESLDNYGASDERDAAAYFLEVEHAAVT